MALAHCLAEVASWIKQAHSILISAMTGGAPLVRRVKRLLHHPRPGTAEVPQPWWTALMIAWLLLISCIAPSASLSTFATQPPVQATSSPTIAYVIERTTEEGAYHLAVRLEGQIHFTNSRMDVEQMAPGSLFVIEEQHGSVSHSLKITAGPDGRLQRSYQLEKEERPFDRDGQRWLAQLLPRMLS